MALSPQPLHERIAKCQEVYVESDPDGLGSVFALQEPGPLDGHPQALDAHQKELGMLKFVLVDALMQQRFAAGCLRPDLAESIAAQRGQDLERARQEAKARNKALKRERAAEEEVHKQLLAEIFEVCLGSREGFDRCTRDYQEIRGDMEQEAADEEKERELLERTMSSTRHWEVALQDAAEVAHEGAKKASALQPEVREVCAKRARLEAELREVEAQCRVTQEQAARLEGQLAQRRARSQKTRHLYDLGADYGLQSLDFDDERGVVVVGGDPELGAVRLAHHEDGFLAGAEPHPSLHLEREAALAVEQDDLSIVLGCVRDRLLEPAQRGDA